MALGRRKDQQQDEMFVMAEHLPKAPGHVFFRKLNAVLREAGFDRWVEDLCRPYYAEERGRPGIPPGTYFRMLLVGYFEGIGSQRGIAWRCSDSFSLRDFLAIPLRRPCGWPLSRPLVAVCDPPPFAAGCAYPGGSADL